MPNTSRTNRRDFLRASVATSALFGCEAALSSETTRSANGNRGKAKNVVFMVSDGMNHGALSLARQFRELEGRGETVWTRLYRERPVVRALAETFSANSCVTDSAAAASAWGGGQRVNNGSLNILPDGSQVKTLHEKLAKSGRRTGLVTTATITHATPAGFAANMPSRSDEAEIAAQYLDRRVDVLLGGGRKFYSPELIGRYRAAGYSVVESSGELAKIPADSSEPLLGIFYEGHLPYSIDHLNVPELRAAIPTLAEMTRTALQRLEGAPEGFFLMVEGARIDHAGHANDAAASIHDQLAFDDAIGAVLEFLEREPDTLVVITTDHGCGGIQMNGVNPTPGQGFAPGIYAASSQAFEQIRGFNRSVEWMKQNGVNGLSGPPLGEALKLHTGLELSGEELKAAKGLKSTWTDLVATRTGIDWTSGNHTGELVEFCAFGPGSAVFPALLRNDETHDFVLQAMDLAGA